MEKSKFSRQAKVKRIQHHQSSFITKAKGTSLGRKPKRRKRPTEKPKTIEKMVIGSYILIITLNVNVLNAPTKRHILTGWMKTCACMHFHLLHPLTDPPPKIVCNYFILLVNHAPIMNCNYNFIFFAYWLWKLINIFYYCDDVTTTQYHWLIWSTEK